MNDSDPTSKPQKRVAFVLNELSPYRIHKLRRFAEEIPEIKVWSLLTRDRGNFKWTLNAPASIHQVSFEDGAAAQANRLSRAWGDWRRAGRIIRWMMDNQIEAVVVFGYGDIGMRRIIRWAHGRGLPCLMWGDSNIRDDRPGLVKGLLKKWMVGRIVGQCDALLPCGSRGKEYYLKYGATAGKIFFVPNEPDYSRFAQPTADALQHVRQKLQLAENRRRMLFSGRLAAVKRVDLLIAAFAAIAGERAVWDLVIVGDGPLRQELEARVPPGLRPRVRWVGFLDDQNDLGAVYYCSDVLVLPSDFEPWALVVNEAAAAGLAIVTSDIVGASPELVREGVNGFTFPAGDLAALTRRLGEVTDPGNIDRMRGASHGVLAEWRRVADPVEGLRRALTHCGVLPGA